MAIMSASVIYGAFWSGAGVIAGFFHQNGCQVGAARGERPFKGGVGLAGGRGPGSCWTRVADNSILAGSGAQIGGGTSTRSTSSDSRGGLASSWAPVGAFFWGQRLRGRREAP